MVSTGDALGVWLDRRRVAVIAQRRGRLTLTYSDEAFEVFSLGAPVVSLSLPLRPERYTHGVVAPFIDGLLPEGDARRVIANDLGVDANDTFALIAALGGDCAGALVIQPFDDPVPPPDSTTTAELLSDAALSDLVANLRMAPLGISARVRVSLAGVQEKLALTRLDDGRWGRPVDRTPSTHIIKPDIAAYPATVDNEAFCMRIAAHAGLRAASVETLSVAGRRLIAVERYDRIISSDRTVRRVHQEDLCQATATAPQRKYQDDGGPSLARLAALLTQYGPPDSLQQLLEAVTLNVVIGNGDAHAKNYSLLHHPTGTIELAPLYDLVATLAYGDDRLAMHIDNVRRTERVTATRLANEAATWGLDSHIAHATISHLLERLPAAIDNAHNQTPDLPGHIAETVTRQLTNLANH